MPTAIDTARVLLVRLPSRDWNSLLDWAGQSHEQRLEMTQRGVLSLPFPRLDYSSMQPLVVLLLRESSTAEMWGAASYRGRYPAGSGLSQLEIRHVAPLNQEMDVRRLRESAVRQLPAQQRFFPDDVLRDGGLLPPRMSDVIKQQLWHAHPELKTQLDAHFFQDTDNVPEANPHARFLFQQQTDATRIALAIARIDPGESLQLPSEPDLRRSFLEQIPIGPLSEEQVLRWDAERFPGMEALRQTNPVVRQFRGSGRQLDLIFAHREPLETAHGVDFIYHNQEFGSFVLVQYKMLSEQSGQAFYSVDDHMRAQIQSMRSTVLATTQTIGQGPGYRLGTEACFWKFVSRYADLQSGDGLIPGHYLPLGMVESSISAGPRGGERIEPETLPRKLSNTDFAALVRDAWVGTTGTSTTQLERVIMDALQAGRAVLAARSSLVSAT